MAWPYQETTFDVLGGFNDQDNPADIVPGKHGLIRMVQAQNVYQPGDRHDLMTVPGFDARRSSAINAAGIFTGGIDFGELASLEFVTVSIAGGGGSHNIYRNNANPPGAVSGGTNFTIGQDNLIDILLFTDGTNKGAIFLSRLRDTPQFIETTPTRSDFTIAGTGLTALKPAIGEVFAQRAIYADANRDGTVEDDFIYWSDLRDGNLITDYLTQRESVETRDKDKVRAVRRLSDVCLVGKMNHLFLLAAQPLARQPYAMRELPLGYGRGPISQQGTVATQSAVYWMGKHGLYRMNLRGEIDELAPQIRPTLTGLNQAKIEFCVAGLLPSQNLILWSVAPSGASSRTRQIAYNEKTGEVFLWTRTRNAYWNYFDSDVLKLSGGGEVGLFYEELMSATGDIDDATAAIDADIISPRHRFPGLALFAGVKVGFDQQGTSEAVTVQYRLNDASSWSSFSASPYTVAGTAGEHDEKFFPLMKTAKTTQLRFRDANSGQQMRVRYYTLVWRLITPGLSNIN